MQRRLLLLSLAVLAACQQLQNATPNQVAADAELVANGLLSALPLLQALTNLPADVLSKVEADITQVKGWADKVAGSADATSWIQLIGPAVVEIAQLVLPFLPGGSAAAAIIQAAVSLLPALFAAVGLSGAPQRTAYTPDAARMILTGATQGH